MLNEGKSGNYEDYYTPFSAWENIKDYIPKDKNIWEAFYGDGKSGDFLSQLGFSVIHEKIDFFEENRGDIIVSNPPFSKIPKILKRIKLLNKPFILIMPSSKINTQYFRNLFSDEPDPIQIIIPRKRINFYKPEEDIQNAWCKSSCCFDCFYYCWKINLPRDIVWLN